MRLASIILFLGSIPCLSSISTAQSSNLELEAGLGYARVFDGGGFSLSAALDHPLGSTVAPLHHAVGVSLWYAHTKVASSSSESSRRDMLGLGIRYRLGWQSCCGPLHPFAAVPLQVLRSSIEDVPALVAQVAAHDVPELPGDIPTEDFTGAAWGWGAGLELGLEVGLAEGLNGETRVQGLYHDIYDGAASNTAWAWHTGLSYRF
jgi:hypothetical protein